MDYGRPITFGYFPSPDAQEYGRLVETIRLADELGLELIGIQDHPYQPRFFDTWTLISAIAPQTRKAVFFPDVANVPLRPPAVLAKAAASLDHITGGRIELGLGAGGFWQAIAAMGGRQLGVGDSVSALEEAIQVIRLMWSGERSVRFAGRFYSLGGTRPGPTPAHPMGIWVGSYRPRMLRLTGRLADGWVPSLPYLPLEQMGEAGARIDEAAAAAGRDPRSVRRVCNVWGRITDGRVGAPDQWEWPVEQWVEVLTTLALEHGIDSFPFGPAGDPVSQLRRWAEEVAPAVRINVDRARARPA